MKPISNEELAYLAGLIEGEGSLGITNSKPPKETQSPRYLPRFTIAMTDKGPIEFCARVFECRIYLDHKAAKRKMFVAHCPPRIGAELLPLLIPYFKSRRKKAEARVLLKLMTRSKFRGPSLMPFEEVRHREGLWEEYLDTRLIV